jgi:histidine triad (HIT) family protein
MYKKEKLMCIFCKIVEGEIPSNKILENDNFICFHDVNPRAPIHLLIIPKVHIEKFQDAPADLMSDMTLFMQEVAIKMGLDKNGYRLIVNNGEDGGQEVPHLHFHMLGGTKLNWPHFSAEETHKSL